MKKRLDMLLVERGLFPTRAKAQAAILAGRVRVKGRPFPKAGMELPESAETEVLPDAQPYVSRGGLKLAAALERFGIETPGRVALDVGASTGGFTDSLLQRGAAKVYAVDVGHGQLDAKLRSDPRVVNLEKTHARSLSPGMFSSSPPDLAVIDVSFISLTAVLPSILACLKPPYEIVALIKPQFELEPKKVPKGVVRKEEHRAEAVAHVRKAALSLPLVERGLLESPVKGPKGNVEFLWYAASPRREVKTFSTAEYAVEAGRAIVSSIARLRKNGKRRISLGLSGGSTPRALHAALAGPLSAQVPWEDVDVFWSDERCVPPSEGASNFRMAEETLLSKIPIPEGNVHRLRGEAPPEEEARRYEEELRSVLGPEGGLDILVLGVGEDGHTASLFPGQPALKEDERWVAAASPPGRESRLTLTLPFINRSAFIFVLAAGKAKADVVQKALSGSGAGLPIERARAREGLVWLLDKDAAKLL